MNLGNQINTIMNACVRVETQSIYPSHFTQVTNNPVCNTLVTNICECSIREHQYISRFHVLNLGRQG